MTDEELAVDGEEQTDEAQQELSDDEIAMAKLKEAITVESEDLGGLRMKLTITVPQDTVDERMGEQFMELKREALIPGFRKGHAPMQLVEKRFAHDVGDELKGKLVGSGYLAAVEKEDLKPLGDPMVWVKLKEERVGEDEKPRTVEVDKLVPFGDALDHMKLPPDAPLTFSCELEVKPDFELPELDKIPVEKPVVTVDDEDIDTEVERLRMMRGTFQPVEDGEVELNDMLYTAMKLTVDGELITSEDNYDVAARDINIKGIQLTGLGDALAGKKVDDTVAFEATVPDDHENLDLRGKTAKFEFVIHEVKRLELPPIDDTFLSNMGLESEDDLRNAVREGLEGRIASVIQTGMQEQIGAYLVENTKIEIPEGLSQRQTERSVARRVMEMYQSGLPQAEIAKEMDKLRTEARDRVLLDLKLFFILEKIAEEREVEITEEQINGAIAQIAQRSNKRFDRVRDELSKGEGLSTLYLRLRDEKVLAELLEKAEITEKQRPKKKKQPAKAGKKPPAATSKKSASKAPNTAAKSAKKAAPKKTAKKAKKKT